jgi:predicted ribosomally synthesized peptide with SipW-like signal peptide
VAVPAQGIASAVVIGRACFVAVVSLSLASALIGGALALFTDSANVSGNAFTADTLNPPTGVSATSGASITLNWTPTVDTYAAGHRVLRGTATGGPYSQIAQVTPRTTATYVDSPAAGTYFYVLRAYYQNWESVNSSEVSAGATVNTGYLSCAANAAVTNNSGDNNGFQLNPGNACADDAAFAEDTNSGSNTNTACNDSGKDRHLYYNYGFSVPAGATINGIQVRLDAWADSTTGSPFLCVELSWDGGTTWTATKQTATLTTGQLTYTLGAANDTWGRTWAATEFANASFRVRITSVASNISRDHRLDWAAVQVTYTP